MKEIKQVTAFEKMKEAKQDQLIGGYSAAISDSTFNRQSNPTNNCGGNNADGNCIQGCSNTNIACL